MSNSRWLRFTRRALLIALAAGASLTAVDLKAQPMLHPMFADVAAYGVRVKVQAAPGVPWEGVERELTRRVRALVVQRAGGRKITLLPAADPRETRPDTLVLEAEARIVPAAQLAPGTKGYVMAFTIRPVRTDSRLPPPPIFPGPPEIVHAASVGDLVRKAEASGALVAAIQRAAF